MAQIATEVATGLSGIVKRKYTKEGIANLQGEEEIVQKDAAISVPDEIGQDYAHPVILTTENGVSYAASGYQTNVATPSTFVMQQAVVTIPSILMNSGMDYQSVFQAYAKGEAAFDSVTSVQMDEMVRSMKKRVEVGCLYGGQFLARIASTSGSGTSRVLTITTGDWSGIWSGSEGTNLDAWQSNLTTQINTTNSPTTPFTVTAANFSAKTLTVSGNATDLTALSTYVSANPNSAGLVYQGTGVSTVGDQEQIGLQTIFTTSGTLFNIATASYSLWQGNSASVGGALTFSEIQAYVAVIKQKGMGKGVLKVLVSPATWVDLLNNQAAYRMLDSSYSTSNLDNGAEKLTFYGQTGRLEIEPHMYVKEGNAFIYEPSSLKRIASTDVTLSIPGTLDGKVFIQSGTSSSFTYRGFTAQQIFCLKPARGFFLSGITN